MTIEVNCGPAAYSELWKQRRASEKASRTLTFVGSLAEVAVGWNAPWRWKTTSPKCFGAIMFSKWQAYSLFPDLSQNKANENNSHAAIIATWHHPAHIQCRMHFAFETGAGNVVFCLYGTWAKEKHDDKHINFNAFWISNAYYSSWSRLIPRLCRGRHEAHPCRNSKWQITDQSAFLRTVFLSFHVVDGNGTGCVLGPQLSSAFETVFLLGTDCPPVNQEVTWLAVLKIYPKSHPSSFSRGSVGKKSTQVQFLDQEAPLREEMATHSSILAWKIPWTEEPGGLQSMRL